MYIEIKMIRHVGLSFLDPDGEENEHNTKQDFDIYTYKETAT